MMTKSGCSPDKGNQLSILTPFNVRFSLNLSCSTHPQRAHNYTVVIILCIAYSSLYSFIELTFTANPLSRYVWSLKNNNTKMLKSNFDRHRHGTFAAHKYIKCLLVSQTCATVACNN